LQRTYGIDTGSSPEEVRRVLDDLVEHGRLKRQGEFVFAPQHATSAFSPLVFVAIERTAFGARVAIAMRPHLVALVGAYAWLVVVMLWTIRSGIAVGGALLTVLAWRGFIKEARRLDETLFSALPPPR
jgi:hypothetical protein